MGRVRLCPTCPGAEPLDGPPTEGPSIVCRPMQLSRSLGATGRERDATGVLLTAEGDPSSIEQYCLTRYTSCPVWVAEKRRIAESRAKLRADADLAPSGA